MDIVTAAQFDKDLSKNLSSLPVHCGFEAEFASAVPHDRLPTILEAFLKDPSTDLASVPDTTGPKPGIKIDPRYGASHGSTYTKWSVETDSTVRGDEHHPYAVELVSPILSLPAMIHGLKAVTSFMQGTIESPEGAETTLAQTNKETGCHLTFSIEQVNPRDVDVLKLAVLLGENHWADVFDRHDSGWADEATAQFIGWLKSSKVTLENVAKRIGDYLSGERNSTEDYDLSTWLTNNTYKYRSINMSKDRKGIIEFRLPGGKDYQYRFDKLAVMAERFAYAFYAAADKDAYADYYRKKLISIAVKFLNSPESASAEASQITDATKVFLRIRSVAENNYLCFLTEDKAWAAPIVAIPLQDIGDGSYKIVSIVAVAQQDFKSVSGTRTLVKASKDGSPYFKYYLFDPKFKIADGVFDGIVTSFLKPKTVTDVRKVPHYVILATNEMNPDVYLQVEDTKVDSSLPAAVQEVLKEEQESAESWIKPDGKIDVVKFRDLVELSDIITLFHLHKKYNKELNDAVNQDSDVGNVALLAADVLAEDKFNLGETLGRSAQNIASYITSESYARDLTKAWGEKISLDLPSSLEDLVDLDRRARLATHYRLYAACSGAQVRRIQIYPDSELEQTFYLDVIRALPDDYKEKLLRRSSLTVASLLEDTTEGHSAIKFEELSVLIDHIPDPVDSIDPRLENLFQNIVAASVNDAKATYTLLAEKLPKHPNFVKQLQKAYAEYCANSLLSSYDDTDSISSWLRSVSSAAGTEFKASLPDASIQKVLDYISKGIDAGTLHIDSSEVFYCASVFVSAYALGLITAIPVKLDKEHTALAAVNWISAEAADYGDKEYITICNRLLSIAPKLKSYLYKEALHDLPSYATAESMRNLARASAKFIAIGYASHGSQAFGAGSATFFNALVKHYKTAWNSSAMEDLLNDLDSLCSLPRPLPSCPLFDAIAKVVASYPLTGDPAANECQAKLSEYVVTSKTVANKKDVFVAYPKMQITLSAVDPIAYPDDVPPKYRLAPKQLAAFFGSASDETFDHSSLTPLPFKASHLLISNMRAYTVEQLKELASYPAPTADAMDFGDTLSRTIFAATKSGTCPADSLTVNTVLALMNSSSFLLNYIDSIKAPGEDFYRYHMFAADDQNVDIGASVFTSLLPAYQVFKDSKVPEARTLRIVPFVDIVQLLVSQHALTGDAFCSKEFVSFYKFCVKNGIAAKVSSNEIPGGLLLQYGQLDLYGKHAAIIDAILHDIDVSGVAIQSLYTGYGYPYYGNK